MKSETKTLQQFREYRERWAEKAVRSYMAVLGVPLEWVLVMLSVLLGIGVAAYICLANRMEVWLIAAMVVLAFVMAVTVNRYLNYREMRRSVDNCMRCLDSYEKVQHFHIELDNILARKVTNDRGIKRCNVEIRKSALPVESLEREKLLLQEDNAHLSEKVRDILENELKIDSFARNDEADSSEMCRLINSKLGEYRKRILDEMECRISDVQPDCFRRELKQFVYDSIDKISKARVH